jgi:hypothetical protein
MCSKGALCERPFEHILGTRRSYDQQPVGSRYKTTIYETTLQYFPETDPLPDLAYLGKT